MEEHPDAARERHRLSSCTSSDPPEPTHLSNYINQGLAYTVGSALGFSPPHPDECLAAFVLPNKAGLTAGSRAWSKHAHRSQGDTGGSSASVSDDGGWWGSPSGPVAHINAQSLQLFWKVANSATWRNLHWLPHKILVYEVRVQEGYGMRWSQNWSAEDDGARAEARPWVFRGFVEPMMDNGHEVGWRH